MEGMSRRVPLSALVALAFLAAACGSGADDDGDSGGSVPAPTPVPTIGGVGELPDPVTPERSPIVMVRPPVDEAGTQIQLVGDVADGNRVLLIGDSILASTSRRYGGQMCKALVPLGWQVDVEAEPSRFIDFGNRVLDRVLQDDVAPEDDWNAAVVFLGSNYGGDPVRFEEELRKILDRLAPRPTLLLTVTQYRPDWAEANEVIRRLADEYEHVTLVDWESIAATPGVLSSDRLHPTEEGRQVLAEVIAASLGQVAVGEGECLKSQFSDDSAINSGGGGGSSVGGSSSSGAGKTPKTTTPTVTTTSAPATVPSTTVPGAGGGGGGGGLTTTSPPATTAPTAPPTTQPPTVPTLPATTLPAAPP